ncbi:unnamed protein product [Cyclocybe aegerita]|uniref:Uncharacterized protein n=1 Tax=Cyclocybe aegerita TaxID=1973307 RepID=A0A8S0W6K6_CYCAE|nr:unnamed protein product [Cyclocybe aegerita]
MANPADFVPAVLDPLLEYLAARLPPPLYSLLVSILSHSFATATAVAGLCGSLLSSHPSEWNAQTLLPPFITIVAAYLALASLYRTTRWFLRLTFFFVKWGTLFGVLIAGAGYLMGDATRDVVGTQGIIPVVVDILAGLFDDTANGEDTRPKSRSTRRRKPNKPKPWDSFEQHKQWKYEQESDARRQNPQAQQVIDMITGAAGQLFGRADWLSGMSKDESPPRNVDGQKKRSKGADGGSGRTGSSRSS